MSQGFGSDYQPSYRPYMPYGQTGMSAFDMGLMFARMGGVLPNSGSFMSPFNNLREQVSAQEKDIVYQEMIRSGVRLQSQQFAQVLGGAVGGFQGVGGQPLTADQLKALQSLATSSLTLGGASPFMSGAFRSGLDIAAGGAAVGNTAFGLAGVYKRLLDPASGGFGLSTGTMEQMLPTLHGSVFGSNELERRYLAQGFSASAMPEMLGYLSARGRLGDGLASYRAMQNSGFVSAVRSGRLNEADLERMGMSGIGDIINSNPTNEEMVGDARRDFGTRAGRNVRETFAAVRSIQELIGPNSQLVEGFTGLLEHMEAFTRKYNQQISGRDIASIIRQTRHSLSELGYSYEDITRLQSYVGGMSDQFGYRGAAAGYAMPTIAAEIRGASNRQAFSVTGYGKLNESEFAQQTTQDAMSFGRSERGRALSAILVRADEAGDSFTDDAAGRRAAEIVRNLREGAPTGDDAFDNASPTEQMDIIARGMQGNDNLARMIEFSNSDFVSEKGFFTNQLDGYFRTENRRDFIEGAGSVAASRALSGLGGSERLQRGLQAGIIDNFLGMTQEQLGDAKVARESLGSFIYDYLKSEGQAGLLGDDEKSQRDAAAEFGARFLNDIEVATGDSALNINNRVGDDQLVEGARARRFSIVRAAVDEMLTGSTNTNIKDSLSGLTSYLQSKGIEASTPAKMAEALAAAFKTGGAELDAKQLEKAIERSQQLSEELGQDSGDGPRNEAYSQHRKKMQAELESQTKFISDTLEKWQEAYKAENPAAEGTGSENDPGSGSGSSGANQVVLSNVTFNFGDDVTVAINGQVRGQKSTPQSTGNV